MSIACKLVDAALRSKHIHGIAQHTTIQRSTAQCSTAQQAQRSTHLGVDIRVDADEHAGALAHSGSSGLHSSREGQRGGHWVDDQRRQAAQCVQANLPTGITSSCRSAAAASHMHNQHPRQRPPRPGGTHLDVGQVKL